MEQLKENKMGTMPIPRLLVSMSLPMVISMLIQALYNLVDSMFVANINNDALTALGMAFPMQSLMIAFQTGLGVGMNALVSKLLGQGKNEQAARAALHGLILTGVNYIIFFIVGLFALPLFFSIQTNSQSVIGYGVEYLSIICCCSFGLFMQICLERFLQSTGKTVYSMILQATGAVINIILDPVLIFGVEALGIPAMGVTGAALATVIGQIIGCIVGIVFQIKCNKELTLSFKGFKINGGTIKTIYAVGIPSIIMSALVSVLTFGMNVILKSFEEAAATTFGIYFKVQSFVYMPVFGMNNGLVPIIAYNYGAGKGDRIVKTVKLGAIVAAVMMFIGLLIFQIVPELLLSLFNPSEDILRIGIPAFRIFSISFAFAGISIVLSSCFQALGNGFYSMVVFLIRLIFPTLPLAALLGHIGGLNLLWFSMPICDMLGLCMAAIFMTIMYRRVIKPMIQQNTA